MMIIDAKWGAVSKECFLCNQIVCFNCSGTNVPIIIVCIVIHLFNVLVEEHLLGIRILSMYSNERKSFTI